MKAAVFHAPDQPLTTGDIDHAAPGRREVLLRTAFAGRCHSDLHFREGSNPAPRRACSAMKRRPRARAPIDRGGRYGLISPLAPAAGAQF